MVLMPDEQHEIFNPFGGRVDNLLNGVPPFFTQVENYRKNRSYTRPKGGAYEICSRA
jgi:hypothetical protein